jgi:hypothetical protein
MRLFDIARIAALISCAALLSACPKKDTEAAPEPGVSAAPAAVQAPVSDKAGAEPAAPAQKKDEDKGGW